MGILVSLAHNLATQALGLLPLGQPFHPGNPRIPTHCGE